MMISNDTSTFLRAFPRRKAWYDTFQHNYKRNRLTKHGTKTVVITLWNLTRKYEVALKQHEVVPVKEAEIDREEVTDAYRVLETPWERNLDGRFYHTLASMQHHRDSQLAAPEIAPEEWISQFANEVKRRATPLLFLINPDPTIPPLDLPPTDSPVTMAEPPSQDDQQAMRRHRIPFKEISIDVLDARRASIVKRLQGKRYNYTALSELLTNWELDLLSQLIRDNILPATFEKTALHFRKPSPSRRADSTFAAVAIAAKNHEEVTRR
jgi:hypothetical protein